MTKGVNRQVLEIHDTGSDYFEKALFFIKPEFSTLGENKLASQAREIIKNGQTIPKTRALRRKNGILLAAKLTAAAGVGAALTMIIK